MAGKLPVWGIDVGQCSLKAIKLQLVSEQQVEMLAVDVVEHESPLSQAESEAPELIKKAIETFLSRNNIRDSLVAVAVSGQQTLTRFTKMPPVEQKKIPDMVQYEASQQIPFDMDEVVWDYQVFTEADSPDVEVGIFAIRKELIRNHLRYFTDRGIEPIVVQTSPMASYNAARFETPAAEGEASILLDMGALATDLIVFEGNRIWSRPVPIGGNRFTESLVAAFKIPFKKAEKLKRTAATSKYARQVFQAMRPVLADLVSEVQRSVGFYTSTHRDARVTRVLGMGNAFKLPGLQKFLQQHLQVEVEKITGFKKMTVSTSERAAEFAENTMSLAVAYGLALQGLGLAAVDANLLPLEVRRTLLWRRKQVWFGGAAACLAGAAAALWVGNVTASSQLSNGLGSLREARTQPAPSVDAAEQIVRGGASTASVEWAAKVAGAAEKLKQEYSQVANMSVGDQATLTKMAGLVENDIIVPRILDLVHEAFGQATPRELAEAKTPEQYVEIAKRTPRKQRRELLIKNLEMTYDPEDARSPFGEAGKEELAGIAAKGGWAVRIIGQSTDPNVASWIDEKLINVLDRLGKRPGRGIYVASVKLGRVLPASDKEDIGTGFDMSERGSSVVRGGKEPGPGGTRRSTPSGGTRRGATRTGRGTGGEPTMGGPMGRGFSDRWGPAGSASELGELGKLAERFRTEDPLTGEKTDGDMQFEVLVVVYKEDTPDKLIPEEFKPRPPEKESSKPGGPEPGR